MAKLRVVCCAVFLFAQGVSADDAVEEAGDEPQVREHGTVVEVVPAGVGAVIGLNRSKEFVDRIAELAIALIGHEQEIRSSQSHYVDPTFNDGTIDPNGAIAIFIITPDLDQLQPLLQPLLDRPLDPQDPLRDPRLVPLLLPLLDHLLSNLAGVFVTLNPERVRALLPPFLRIIESQGNQAFLFFKNDENEDVEELLARPKLETEFSAADCDRLNEADVVALFRIPNLPEHTADFFSPSDFSPSDSIAIAEDELDFERQLRLLGEAATWWTLTASVAYGAEEDESPIGCRLRLSTLFDHSDDSESARLLVRMSDGVPTATLAGLPTGDAIFAIAGSFPSSENQAILSKFARFAYLRNSLFADQLLALFGNAGDLDGGRLAVYRNYDFDTQGRFSLVMILDTEDPAAYLDELQEKFGVTAAEELGEVADMDLEPGEAEPAEPEQISELVEQFGDADVQVRRSAFNRLVLLGSRAVPFLEDGSNSDSQMIRVRSGACLVRISQGRSTEQRESRPFLYLDMLDRIAPEFSYVVAGETLTDGTTIDLLSVTVLDEGLRISQQFASWLGPDWNRWRIAKTDGHVIIVIGSQSELLDQALQVLRGDVDNQLSSSLQDDAHTPHQYELYYDLHAFSETLPYLANPAAEQNNELLPVRDWVNVGLTINGDRIDLDVWIPLLQLSAMLKAMENMMGIR